MRKPAAFAVRSLALTVLLAPVAPRFAHADAQQQQSFGAWRQMGDCARQAAKQFPDHTPEGNAQRETARQNCLRVHHLPISAPPPPGH
jgi:hypothetical protein